MMGPSPDVYCPACDVFDVDQHRHGEVEVGGLWRHRSGAIRVVTFLDGPVGHETRAVLSYLDGTVALDYNAMEVGRDMLLYGIDPDWTLLSRQRRGRTT